MTNIEDRIWAKEVLSRGNFIYYTATASVTHYHGLNHSNSIERLKGVVKVLENQVNICDDSYHYISNNRLIFNLNKLLVFFSNEFIEKLSSLYKEIIVQKDRIFHNPYFFISDKNTILGDLIKKCFHVYDPSYRAKQVFCTFNEINIYIGSYYE